MVNFCICPFCSVAELELPLPAFPGGDRAWSLGEAYAPEALQAEEEENFHPHSPTDCPSQSSRCSTFIHWRVRVL